MSSFTGIRDRLPTQPGSTLSAPRIVGNRASVDSDRGRSQNVGLSPKKPHSRRGVKARSASSDSAPATTGRMYRDFRLNPFQEEALTAIEAGRSVLLSAPTGAGKTLVAEYAIEETLKQGRRAIYTAPIKALSSQKYRDFKELGIDVGIMTGDVTIHPLASLLVMTTEIFRNTIFESPDELDDVQYVVFDEIHYMDDVERGTVWEESIIFAPEHIDFICLSATVSNLSEFGEWIGRARGRPIEVIKHEERPVPLTDYLFFPGIGPKRADKVKTLPRMSKRRGRGPKNDVLDFLEQQNSMPVLFFCFSRKDCERRAKNSQKRTLLSPAEQKKMEVLFEEIRSTFQMPMDAALEGLKYLAMCGVGFHHAGLLPLHKELVERLFTSGFLKLLFTTETFALGINMPARSVVFASLRKFDGVGFDFIKCREYQQMAGRAGRQGIDDVGLVYSVIDDPRVRDVRDVQRVLFGHIESIKSRFRLSYSSLLNLHRALGPRIFDAWESSFNNFQWVRMPRKKREKNEAKQRNAISQRLELLRELGYLEGDHELTDKGCMAALINGFELGATELFFSGLLEWFSEVEICIVVGSLVFEERRGDVYQRMPKGLLGEHRQDVERVVRKLVDAEARHDLPPSISEPNWLVGGVMNAFANGADVADLEQMTNASLGDLVRTFRLTVQVLRQLKKAVRKNRAFTEKLSRAIERINRDVVDAKAQLELG